MHPDIIIPFCKPSYGAAELAAIEIAIQSGCLHGGGSMNKQCETLLEASLECNRALITPSCTAALEMMALALDLQPGDEIIMPSFTFVSTANAFALRGAVPVFVDINANTFNIDPDKARAAITPKTRAIMIVHYGGVGCDMLAFEALCQEHNLTLLEDAAQAIGASWNNRPLGSFGAMSAFSFHHTKNITCGEGGALVVNDSTLVQANEIIREKGTDRNDFLKGNVKKYQWKRLGSSYLLSELAAAVLSEQLLNEAHLTQSRLAVWQRYEDRLSSINSIQTSYIPPQAQHNGHIYSILFKNNRLRNNCADYMRQKGIIAAPHYVPLHLTPAGRQFGYTHGDMIETMRVSDTQLRLPIYSSMTITEQDQVIQTLIDFLYSESIVGFCD